MKIEKAECTSQSESFDEIVSEGMIEMAYVWVKCEVSVEPDKETEKAYHGEVTVYEVDDFGRSDIIYETTHWIPKSMTDNPWWICTNIFGHNGKVANRRFDDGY